MNYEKIIKILMGVYLLVLFHRIINLFEIISIYIVKTQRKFAIII